jgi:thioredoxin-related protein
MFAAKLRRLWLAIRSAGVLAVLSICLCGVASAGSTELIMFEEDGCGWCERWNKEVGIVYHKTVEGKRAPLRRMDIHEPLPRELRFIAKGGYTPTFVLVDQEREIGRIRGYPGEEFFWGLLGKMLERLPAGAKNPATVN